jgi:hypothetical protein
MGDGREGLIAAIQEECAVQHIMVPSALAASTGVAQVEDGLEAPAFSNPPPPPNPPVAVQPSRTVQSASSDDKSGPAAMIAGIAASALVILGLLGAAVRTRRPSAPSRAAERANIGNEDQGPSVEAKGGSALNENPMFGNYGQVECSSINLERLTYEGPGTGSSYSRDRPPGHARRVPAGRAGSL